MTTTHFQRHLAALAGLLHERSVVDIAKGSAAVAVQVQHPVAKIFAKAEDMGIPYSKQINAAFDQVTPLVAKGFDVLHKTKNITLLLAEIQVVTVLLLFSILVALLMLLITSNPDLDQERKALVTPVLKWICSWAMAPTGKGRFGLIILSGVLAVPVVGYLHWWLYFREKSPFVEADEDDDVMSLPPEEPESPVVAQPDEKDLSKDETAAIQAD